MLAGVSTDYYIRLEQGRERRPSEQVLGALARVLDLGEDGTDHLHALAYPWTRRRRRPASRIEPAHPSLARMMESWDHAPAFVLGRWLDVLACNRPARALTAGLEHSDNLIRLIFLNPDAQWYFAEWEKTAYEKAAWLRAAAGTDPDDPFLPELVEELSSASDEFRRIWARHDVRALANDVKRLRHPEVGELTVTCEAFTVAAAPGQQLFLLHAEPGSPSERTLSLFSEDATLDAGPAASRSIPRSLPALGPRVRAASPPVSWPTRW